MRLLVVGAGATGGYFGGRLAQARRDVTFLLRPRRAAQVAESGLRIRSPHGDVTLTPKVVTADKIEGPYDAVLLTVKSFALEGAMDDMAGAVGKETMILPTLNGMRHMDSLAERFGAGAVVGCACKVAGRLDPDGTINQLAPFQELVYGEMDGTMTPRMERLDGFMQGAGFDAKLSPTISREMWEKWVLLSAMGSIGALMRGTIGEVVAAPGGPAFVDALLAEVVEAVRTIGVAPSDGFMQAARRQLTQPGSPLTSSMFRDLQAGNRIEADQIVGDLVRRAQNAGVATPLLSAAYANLSIYQARL
jgi:2-dehydropantoate 2-reductase